MQLSLALVFIFAVVEFLFAACAAVGVPFTDAARSSNAFTQNVLFRVHEGVNILSLTSCLRLVGILLLAALVKEFPSKSCAMYGPSHLNCNTSYLVQYHNAGARKDSVPGHTYFRKIEKFMNEHYEEGRTTGSF